MINRNTRKIQIGDRIVTTVNTLISYGIVKEIRKDGIETEYVVDTLDRIHNVTLLVYSYEIERDVKWYRENRLKTLLSKCKT